MTETPPPQNARRNIRTVTAAEWTKRTQRFLPQEDDDLRAVAAARNVSINDLIRSLVLDEIEDHQHDLLEGRKILKEREDALATPATGS